MKNDAFQKSSFSTNFIDTHFQNWNFSKITPDVLAVALLGTKITTVSTKKATSGDPYSPWSSKGGWRQGV